MYTKEKWKLTDEEIAECKRTGCDIEELQVAKKRAFVANGGVILNPDALDPMYEALKHLVNRFHTAAMMASLSPGYISSEMEEANKALAKAEGK